jgi:abnormal spindle-like microcephaly-associated protein
VQYPLDDFKYKITNLAVDLRDGVRLTKLVEVLNGKKGFSSQLRWPAIGVPQRIHNLSVILKMLQAEGISLTLPNGDMVNAFDIEGGNREKTLFVVWCLLSRWRLSRYLENVELSSEILNLKTVLELRRERLPSIKVFH